jgi:hypothetical protein
MEIQIHGSGSRRPVNFGSTKSGTRRPKKIVCKKVVIKNAELKKLLSKNLAKKA